MKQVHASIIATPLKTSKKKKPPHNTVPSYGGSAIVRPLNCTLNMQDTPFALLQAPLSVNEVTATRSSETIFCTLVRL